MNAELIERLRRTAGVLRAENYHVNAANVDDAISALTRPDEAASARRRDALRRMVALDEKMGLYDDEAVPPSRVTPNMTGSVSERFIEALKFARYYLVDALEIQDNADLRDALWTMDCLIDPGNPLAPEATSTQEVGPVSFAWTAANGRPYPPYINLAGNRIRVRGEPSHGEVMPFTTGWIEGPYVSVELPDEAIEGLRQALSRRPADDEVTRLREMLVAKAKEYQSAKRLRPCLSPDDEMWNARMDGAQQALVNFAALATPNARSE